VIVMIDGRICPPVEQVVSVFDRGFLYGDSVFETLRTYGGVPFQLDEHLARLRGSAERVYIPLPVSLAQLGAELHEAVAAGGNAESYMRLMVTRGQGALGLDPSLAEQPRRVILVQPLQAPPEQYYTRGVKAISYRTERSVDATSAAGAKVGNYLVSVLAMREAGAAGAVEALIVDKGGRVLEGASSNVFLVRGGRLITAPVQAGILPGITRAQVLALASEQGLAVDLTAPDLDAAYTADELFITSSIRELVPIVNLDGRVLSDGQPGPVFRRLLSGFRERTRRN
jgi:branched-chain amino acid aminotransferase